MPIIKRSLSDIDAAQLDAELARRPMPSEEEIARQVEEDGGELDDADLARAVKVYAPPSPEEVKALRAKLGMSQAQFAHSFGFTIDTVQQYEQGRRRPSGPAATLLRVIAREPEAVRRALAA